MNPSPETLRHLEALQLEVASVCNLKCIMCPQVTSPDFARRNKGFLSLELLERLLGDLERIGAHFNAVFPFWLGESLLHPRFGSIFQRLMEWNFANARFNHLEFDSNAHFLDAELTDTLLSFPRLQVLAADTFLRLDLSLDAVDPDIYRSIRPGGDPALPVANALVFLAERQRRKMSFPRVTLQMVVQEANAGHVTEFCRFFAREAEALGLDLAYAYACNKDAFGDLDALGDAVFLRPLSTSPARQDDADRLFAETIAASGRSIPWRRVSRPEEDAVHVGAGNRGKPPIRGVCHYLMSRPLVTADGDVLPCFNDEGADLVLGNLREASFAEIWWGRRAEELRRLQTAACEAGRCLADCHGYTPFRESPPPPPRPGILIPPEELP